MSTAFNFPANPALNDTFTLPNGSVSQWNGTEWVGVNTASVTYPLAIGLGGTAGDTAGKARINLGLNLATGEFIVQKDGTAAQPGIAFASEPGLGWYRNGAGSRRFAVGGFATEILDSSAATSTGFILLPRVQGISNFFLRNQPVGSTNLNQLILQQNADGSAAITTSVGGTATRGNLTLDAPGISTTGPVTVTPAAANGYLFLDRSNTTYECGIRGNMAGSTRWKIVMGAASAESGGNVGSDFAIVRYSDAAAVLGTSFNINRATGNVTAQGLTRQEDHDELRATVVAALARITALRATVAGALVRIAALEAG